MRLNTKPRDEVRRAWEEHRAARPKFAEPRPLNLRAVCEIAGDELLYFNGRHYLVPPVTFEDGAVLTDLLAQVQALGMVERPTRAQLEEMRDVLRAAVSLMGSLVRPLRYRARGPRGVLSRMAWRFTGNPFRRATAAEVGWLLGFFCALRTRPRVRHESAIRAMRGHHGG